MSPSRPLSRRYAKDHTRSDANTLCRMRVERPVRLQQMRYVTRLSAVKRPAPTQPSFCSNSIVFSAPQRGHVVAKVSRPCTGVWHLRIDTVVFSASKVCTFLHPEQMYRMVLMIRTPSRARLRARRMIYCQARPNRMDTINQMGVAGFLLARGRLVFEMSLRGCGVTSAGKPKPSLRD